MANTAPIKVPAPKPVRDCDSIETRLQAAAYNRGLADCIEANATNAIDYLMASGLRIEEPYLKNAMQVPNGVALERAGLWTIAPALEKLGYRIHMIRNGAGFCVVPRSGNSQYREGWNACRAAVYAAAPYAPLKAVPRG